VAGRVAVEYRLATAEAMGEEVTAEVLEGTAAEGPVVVAEGTVEEDSAVGPVAVSAVEDSAGEVRAAEAAGVLVVVEEVTGDSAPS